MKEKVTPALLELQTASFTAEREWTAEGVPVLTAAVSLPRPEPLADKVSRRIHRYYQLQCRAFLRYCESWLLPQARAAYQAALESSAPLPEFRAELQYRVTYNEGGLWSLYTQSRERTGTGPALLTRRGDTWDLAQSCPVPLSSFFPPRSAWRRELLERLAEEVRRQLRAGAAQYHEDWHKALRRRFNPQNYYLTQDGLALFYPLYALAPESGGIPTFVIPYRDLGEDWKGRFTVPPPETDSPGD